jgi:serine/threonine protein phosphatase 1
MSKTRTIAIGDPHGCIDELRELISMLGLSPTDRLIFAGDLVDKGPDSPAVVAYCRELTDRRPRGSTELVAGNHEDKHSRFRRHLRLFKEQGKPIPMKKIEELHTITAKLSAADVAYLDTAKLYVKIQEPDALVVHAGVPPSVTFLPPVRDIEQMDRKKADKYKQLLRVRFVNPQGWMVPLGDETDSDVYWAEVYDGRFGHVFYGHHPWMDGPKILPHSTGIDTGCVYGGSLTAAILHKGRVEMVSVKARSKYATGLWDE